MKTLETILKENKKASRKGMFGVEACKQAIKDDIERLHLYNDYYEALGKLVNCFNTIPLYNANMVVACWELINER